MDAYNHGKDVYRVSVAVEILANSADEAVEISDMLLITDKVANDPRFVSFSIATPRGTREVNA
jgi:NMD protein affecting ribosome stability and mRNA decay